MIKYANTVPLFIVRSERVVYNQQSDSRDTESHKEESGLDDPDLDHERNSE
jgi:hypothetical protein